MQSAEKIRTILITGANKGIGYVTVERLLQGKTPFNIILTARNPDLGKKALASLQKNNSSTPSKLIFRELDVSKSSSIDSCVTWIKEEYGKDIDVLINNAGVNTETTLEDRLNVFNINLFGAMELAEKLLPSLAADGKIINISSENGQLSWQGDHVRKLLENSKMTREDFDNITKDLIEKTKSKTHTKDGWSRDAYDNTKVLLNAYTRWILVKMIQGDQQCYTVDPGWCRTEMGTEFAPLPVERGADTPVYLIGLPFKKDDKYNGKFFRNCKLHPF